MGACVSKKTEQLLTCGRMMRVKLHRQSITFAHWVGMRTRGQWELGSCETRQFSLCSGLFSFLFLHLHMDRLHYYLVFVVSARLPPTHMKKRKERD